MHYFLTFKYSCQINSAVELFLRGNPTFTRNVNLKEVVSHHHIIHYCHTFIDQITLSFVTAVLSSTIIRFKVLSSQDKLTSYQGN